MGTRPCVSSRASAKGHTYERTVALSQTLSLSNMVARALRTKRIKSSDNGSFKHVLEVTSDSFAQKMILISSVTWINPVFFAKPPIGMANRLCGSSLTTRNDR